MRIGQFSKAAGLAPSTLRYYERIGLLPKPARRGGKRWYEGASLRRARLLKVARGAGLRISDLKRLVQDDRDPAQRSAVLAARLTAMEGEIARLSVARDVLAAAAACKCATENHCEVLGARAH